MGFWCCWRTQRGTNFVVTLNFVKGMRNSSQGEKHKVHHCQNKIFLIWSEDREGKRGVRPLPTCIVARHPKVELSVDIPYHLFFSPSIVNPSIQRGVLIKETFLYIYRSNPCQLSPMSFALIHQENGYSRLIRLLRKFNSMTNQSISFQKKNLGRRG